ncbi:MAG TPA: site-2 protease family protein [Phycisphaerales bacterium]|nr:site-2 protease family protein [Phycisphaerales bacterium]
MLGTVGDLVLVVIGFSLIIFLHELGHFAAARWARIRVLAFALGFGPAAFSYRKGMGFRRGSSEKEYLRRLQERRVVEQRAGGLAGVYGDAAAHISPTEYRLNVLPLGGYVKMLGQDDSDPAATSSEPDSFSRAPVYKRMVVISAGVVMNIVTAAILFVIVFSYGLRTESPRIGLVVPGTPATTATANVGNRVLTGLQPGDTVLTVGDEEVEAFKDISLAVAMSRKDRPLPVTVRRRGEPDPITFIAQPKVDPGSGMLSLGVAPAFSGTIDTPADEAEAKKFTDALARRGAAGVLPGMTLVDETGRELDYLDFNETASRSGGRPFVTRWRTAGEEKGSPVVEVTLTPQPELQIATVEREGVSHTFEHLAGLTPVMAVRSVQSDTAKKAGLMDGDIFARLGDIQFPGLEEGMRQIVASGDSPIAVTVLRAGKLVDLKKVPVVAGKIGFDAMTTARTTSLITRFPRGKVFEGGDARAADRGIAASEADVTPGSRVVRVGSQETATLLDVRTALQTVIATGLRDVHLTVEVPGAASETTPATKPLVLHLDDADAEAIAGLGWQSPIGREFFKPAEVVLQRSGPVAAVAKGLDETKKMVLTTYLTFARLFQGTVKVEHLKGPIGIADVGTRLAGKGAIWLLFFMAAVSVNLAVVNFLPLPIVDGGHFCFLLWEQFTGRPVSPAVQNVAALVGLALIGAVFLMTTYNDLANLLWR